MEAPPAMSRGRHDARSFATDGQIASRSATGPGRELKKFDDFSVSMPTGPNNGTARHSGKDAETFGDLRPAGKWDQFQVNQEKFGVSTTFDESQYTTTIDRSGPDFAVREREAARLAAEIEGKVATNVHMQEERNQRVQADMDEEAMYSGVQRPAAKSQPTQPTTNNGKFKPQRNGTGGTPKPVRDQLPTGPSKQDARPKNGGPSKPLPKSAIPSKAVWGSKNNPSKQNNNKNNKTANNNKGPSSAKPAASTKPTSVTNNKNFPSAPKSSSPPTKTPAAPAPESGPAPTAVAPAPAKPASQPAVKPAAPAKSTPSTKRLSYAAAAGARSSKAASSPAPIQSIPPVHVDLAQGPKPPRSPISPSTAAGKQAVGRMAPRTHAAARMPNGGRTPPAVARTSPNVARTSPSNPESSAMDALSLESPSPKIIKSFEQFKTKQVVKSITDNREEITNDLKKFSTELDAKRTTPRKSTAVGAKSGEKSVDQDGTGKVGEEGSDANNDTEETGETKTAKPSGLKKKMKMKLNPNAGVFTPGGGSTGGSFAPPAQAPGTAPGLQPMQGSGPMPAGPGMDPYFQMGNFGGVPPPGIPPEHQMPPNINFQMPPPVGHHPYSGYPIMVPGMPQSIPYMAARNPYMMAGNNRMAPSFGIPTPMPIVPGQGNQRTPGMPANFYPPYAMQGSAMPVQAVPAYPPHPSMGPAVAQPVVSPRNNNRRSTNKGRARHQNFDAQQPQQWNNADGKEAGKGTEPDAGKGEAKSANAPAAGGQPNQTQ